MKQSNGSLKQKAKTLNELLWENRLEWDKWLRMGVTEQKQIELASKYQEKWVRLEDAEQAIAELKQKLQQLLTEFPRKLWDEAFEWKDYATEEIDEWKKKFEELLKEAKP